MSESRHLRKKAIVCGNLEFQVIDFYTKDIREAGGYVIFMFGVTKLGQSVCCQVRGYKPYFYVRMPESYTLSRIDYFQTAIKNSVHKYHQSHLPRGLSSSRFHTAKNAYGFRGNKSERFLRFDFPFESTMYATRKAINESNALPEPKLFESKCDTLIKFIHDINFVSWVRINSASVTYEHNSTCEFDISVDYKNIDAFDSDDFAPILQCSMDIEVTSTTGGFPNPNNDGDCVFQIASTFKVFGSSDDSFFLKHILVYGACNDISDPANNVVMQQCVSEKELLRAWAKLVASYNPDVIYTYNGWGFDFEYMYIRAQKHCVHDEFCSTISRLTAFPCELKEESFSSGAYGTSNYKILYMPGRVNFDVHVYLRRETKLEKYKLDFVAEHYLGEKKNPVTPQMIFDAFREQDPVKTADVARYCIQDTLLPQKLVDKLCMLSNQIEMAKATFVPFSFLLNRGQQFKVYSQIIKYARRFGYLIPDWSISFDLPFTGGKVLEPAVGPYWTPIATLDFASLYPSIIRAHNFCYTTIVLDPQYDNMQGVDYRQVTWTDVDKDNRKITLSYKFVQNSQSILPVLLSELYQKRKAVKKEMNAATDDFTRAILNGKQLALKVSMNSVYGFLDANKLPCKPIALSTTATGRQMIDQTKNFVETNYPPAKIIYGDSVMPYTPVVVKNIATGKIEIKEIHEFGGKDTHWEKWHGTKTSSVSNVTKDYQVWTSSGWSKIARLVRHKTVKKIYRVVSEFGIVDVTEDHSLLDENLKLKTPAQILNSVRGRGMLYASMPYSEMFNDVNSDVFTSYKHFTIFGPTFTNQIDAQRYYWQMARRDGLLPKLRYVNERVIGYQVLPDPFIDTSTLTKCASRIFSVDLLYERYHGYVYDLETEVGNYQAGVGCVIVKNTDSVFVDFKRPEISFEELFDLAQRCADHTTEALFKKPIELEFEKVYFPFFIFAKKKYIGKMFTSIKDKGKTSSTGITNRRDMCHFIRDVYEEISQTLLDERLAGIPKVRSYLRRNLDLIMSNNFPIEKFTITKTIRDIESYSDKTKSPQLEVAKKKRSRGETVESNDKITYVILKPRNGVLRSDVSERAEDFEYAKTNKCALDIKYYTEQLRRSIEPLLLLVMGPQDLNLIFNNQPPITSFFKPKPKPEPKAAAAPKRKKIEDQCTVVKTFTKEEAFAMFNQ